LTAIAKCASKPSGERSPPRSISGVSWSAALCGPLVMSNPRVPVRQWVLTVPRATEPEAVGGATDAANATERTPTAKRRRPSYTWTELMCRAFAIDVLELG
jgi:hypothetical protein